MYASSLSSEPLSASPGGDTSWPFVWLSALSLTWPQSQLQQLPQILAMELEGQAARTSLFSVIWIMLTTFLQRHLSILSFLGLWHITFWHEFSQLKYNFKMVAIPFWLILPPIGQIISTTLRLLEAVRTGLCLFLLRVFSHPLSCYSSLSTTTYLGPKPIICRNWANSSLCSHHSDQWGNPQDTAFRRMWLQRLEKMSIVCTVVMI